MRDTFTTITDAKENVSTRQTIATILGARAHFRSRRTVACYLDTAPLPAPGASAVWKYKAIYRLRDEQVGHWSDVASVSVMG